MSHILVRTKCNVWMEGGHEPGLVSIIIPTYNRAHLLKATLDSVLAQTHRPIEVLIVDDGSVDETETKVREWCSTANCQTDLRIHYLHQKNKGAPSARNLGLIRSRGEFIQYLDSDDILHPQKVEVQVAALIKHRDIGYVIARYAVFSQSLPLSSNILDERCSITPLETAPVFTSVWLGLLRRQVAIDVGPWDESFAFWQDVEYNSRIAASGVKTGTMDLVLYFMRDHNGVERIRTQKAYAKNIDPALRAISKIEENLLRGRLQTAKTCDISPCYLRAAGMALKYGTRDQMNACISLMDKFRPNWRFRNRIKYLGKVQSVFGFRVGAFIWETFFYIKSGERIVYEL